MNYIFSMAAGLFVLVAFSMAMSDDDGKCKNNCRSGYRVVCTDDSCRLVECCDCCKDAGDDCCDAMGCSLGVCCK